MNIFLVLKSNTEICPDVKWDLHAFTSLKGLSGVKLDQKTQSENVIERHDSRV